MDRNAPAKLLDTATQAFQDSVLLQQTWHGKGRLQYGVTPRFAITSTPEELALCGKQLGMDPTVLMHTHLSENRDAIKETLQLYPNATSYLDVYDKRGLVTDMSVFAHGIWLSDQEWERLAEAGSSIAHCPTSNLFLGSGLFNLTAAAHYGVNVCIGTDVGAGTSLSMLKTLNEAYKVQQLQGVSVNAYTLFYMATLGGARALHMDKVGSLAVGSEADFVVLSLNATATQRQRLQLLRDVEDELFMLATLGDERNVVATYVNGKKATKN